MSYKGTTEASTVTNPPMRIASGLGACVQGSSSVGGSLGLWLYSSSNLTTDLTEAGFFSDAKSLGMKMGDIVLAVQQSSIGSTAVLLVGTVAALTTAGTAAISTCSMITSTYA
jgi:hypothetical protein